MKNKNPEQVLEDIKSRGPSLDCIKHALSEAERRYGSGDLRKKERHSFVVGAAYGFGFGAAELATALMGQEPGPPAKS